MSARLKASVPKDFEIRTTGSFAVYCLKSEKAFKPVASLVAAAAAAAAAAPAPKGETKSAAADEEDDLDDMFGSDSDDEDAEAAKQAVIDRIAAAHNAKKRSLSYC